MSYCLHISNFFTVTYCSLGRTFNELPTATLKPNPTALTSQAYTYKSGIHCTCKGYMYTPRINCKWFNSFRTWPTNDLSHFGSKKIMIPKKQYHTCKQINIHINTCTQTNTHIHTLQDQLGTCLSSEHTQTTKLMH